MRIVLVVALSGALAGCGGSHSQALPPACSGDSGALLKALRAAPGHVLVGGRPISTCFTRNQDGTALQILGTGLLETAQQLGDRARAGDDQAALRLGYVIGAARRGTVRNNGLGSEIVRRLQAETDGLGATRSAYQRGLRAGLTQG